MRRLIGLVAVVVLLASLVSPGVAMFHRDLAPGRDAPPERGAGMNAPATPEICALAAAVPAALGAPLSVVPRVLTAARLVAAETLGHVHVRAAFVVKSAPTILRV